VNTVTIIHAKTHVWSLN